VHPYNIEVRTTCAPPAALKLPVKIRLLNESGRVVGQRGDLNWPFRLWVGATGSPSQLRNGVYFLESSADGNRRIQFTQACPDDCSTPGNHGKKGMKGCRGGGKRA
jgi:hypothetical protein